MIVIYKSLIIVKMIQVYKQINLYKMAAGGIEERIRKMKEAIKNQAKQRAETIISKAEDEVEQQRAEIIRVQKEKIENQYNHIQKKQKVKAKIQKSSVINRQRIAMMQSRYHFVEKVNQILCAKLRQIVKDKKLYTELMTKIIVQGMLRMMERKVYVEAKKQHSNLIREIFPQCEAQFKEIMKRETGRDIQVTLELSDYHLEDKNKNIIGGVFLRSSDGLIVCDNSIDSRIKLTFEHLLPAIRQMLFDKQRK